MNITVGQTPFNPLQNHPKLGVPNKAGNEYKDTREAVEGIIGTDRSTSPIDFLNGIDKETVRLFIKIARDERHLVALIDAHYPGSDVKIKGKTGEIYTHRGYSKLADYAVSEYRQLKKLH